MGRITRHLRRKSRGLLYPSSSYSERARLYTLRLDIARKEHQKREEQSHDPDSVQTSDENTDRPDELNFRPGPPLEQLQAELAELETHLPSIEGHLGENLGHLERILDLDALSMEILAFLLLLQIDEPLQAGVCAWNDLNYPRLLQILSIAVKADMDQVSDTIDSDGPLKRASLINIDHSADMPLMLKVDILHGLSDRMFMKNHNPHELLEGYFYSLDRPTLTLADFEHHAEEIGLIRAHLMAKIGKRAHGVNILLYGEPGVGKTELAQVIARSLSCDIQAITAEDSDGDPISGTARIRYLQFAQTVLQDNHNTLMLFDEAEDIFPPSIWASMGLGGARRSKTKAWINRLLETNRLPTIWIANQVCQIDPAFIRRYDVVLKIDNLPREQRRQLIRKKLNNLPVGEKTVNAVANTEAIVPALVERTASVIRHQAIESLDVDRSFRRLLSGSLKAMGHSGDIRAETPDYENYDPSLSNASEDLQELAQAIRRNGSGRFCLFGPPGTGKTGYAWHVARLLDRPLLARRASDLLGPYVGQTEAALRQMFEEATRDDAIILLDEADGFLADRTSAHRNWEITQVNELLVGIEQFEGVIFAATNLDHRIDRAARRRFDLRIYFNYLRPDQRRELLLKTLNQLGKNSSEIHESLGGRLDALHNLTPGDFAMLFRQSTFRTSLRQPERLVAALEEESRQKDASSSRPIGFLAHLSA